MNGALGLAASLLLLVAHQAGASYSLGSQVIRADLRPPGLARLQVRPSALGPWSVEFARSIVPEFWQAGDSTTVRMDGGHAIVGPLNVWDDRHLRVETSGADTTYAHELLPGHTLGQSFHVGDDVVFGSVAVKLGTYLSDHPGVSVRLMRDGAEVAHGTFRDVKNNDWLSLPMPRRMGGGDYRVELLDPVGRIGWWSRTTDLLPRGQAMTDGDPDRGDRTLVVDTRADIGPGYLDVTTRGSRLEVRARWRGESRYGARVPWRWRLAWRRDGYDCTAAAGVLTSRFFTDNQRYMAAEQLKRRATAGLAFDNARWVEIEGTRDADLRLSSRSLHLHWEMLPDEMSLRFDTPAECSTSGWSTSWNLEALLRRDSVPDSFPRFECSDQRLTADLNRFWWERAFSYHAPAYTSAGWFEWMALMRGWYAGPQHDGELAYLRSYPISSEGYVHTWGDDPGWPLRPKPTTDTRHFDTNARYLLAVWRYWCWSGDDGLLRQQAARIRSAMRYQLDVLRGRSGLITSVSPDVQGRHGDQGGNYWDILPFGHLDPCANTVFIASLAAMQQMEPVIGGPPMADWPNLRRLARRRFDEVFWDRSAGRYTGAVDADGVRHDYGFTFVNTEALAYGLGDGAKARSIYDWMEGARTSSGRRDTYSRWLFAPRTSTLHNPHWGAGNGEPGPVQPWWVSWWPGAPYGDQCQDGGAILYTSYFDLVARRRWLGSANAWRLFLGIMERYRLPDRLCGGAPLYLGETPQQENPGSVGTDLPFPESGLVPLWFLTGVIGLSADARGLVASPSLPRGLDWAGVTGVRWHGRDLVVRVDRQTVRVWSGPRLVAARRWRPGEVTVLIPWVDRAVRNRWR